MLRGQRQPRRPRLDLRAQPLDIFVQDLVVFAVVDRDFNHVNSLAGVTYLAGVTSSVRLSRA